MHLSEVSRDALVVTACAFGIIGTLVLLAQLTTSSGNLVGGCLHRVWGLLDGRLHCHRGKGRVKLGLQVCLLWPGLSNFCVPPLWVVGEEPQTPPQLEGQGHRPHCHCYLILHGQEASDMCPVSPDAPRFSGSVGSTSVAEGLTDTTSTVPMYSPPLYVPIHPPLHVQLCAILWCPVVWCRGTFVELWMFYWL